MLIFSDPCLAFIAVPKTGTTAFELAYRRQADVALLGRRKHMPAQRYHSKIKPFLADTFRLYPETVAIMRDPLDQIGSWYRYRTRDELKGTDRYTGDMSFDSFVQDLLSDEPPEHAVIGSQHRMLTSKKGELLVDHLFRYEQFEIFEAFLTQRFGAQPELKTQNASPEMELELSPSTLHALHRERAAEFELYERLCDAEGHLRN
ncbi:hypothetical protein Q5Y75_15560 [Ruegeria sp. 2205SS24-7]|uniref:hypothetical protein n=1 Tax=Ruegeria discodermiae TaxID=3064389 RepID=UPI0027426DE9|nr:hypothetical protein [Ruegeria sp. 2205SS24-7]MDP5218645.1 hypothetical protein [Ruegeria sp. 2205SS24-7]